MRRVDGWAHYIALNSIDAKKLASSSRLNKIRSPVDKFLSSSIVRLKYNFIGLVHSGAGKKNGRIILYAKLHVVRFVSLP